MIETFLLVGLPYLAIAMFIFVTWYRLRNDRFSQSALSSQFLENKVLLWGSIPWHIGIFLVLLGHVVALVVPKLWHGAMLNPVILITVESIGMASALLALFGLIMLFCRRVLSARVQSVTTVMDLIVLLILISQVSLGLATAVFYKWGGLWSTATATPYMWSILTFNPDPALIAGLPPLFKAHVILGWVLVAAIPFSRLIHILGVPLGYLFRAPQKVVWNNPRHQAANVVNVEAAAARRDFILGAASVAAGGALLGIGAADKMVRFFFGPRLSGHDQAELMSAKVARLEKTIEQKKFELEREQNDYILISKLTDLSPTEGKYFTDYAMNPGLAFLGKDGLPILLSAKCTHLGCTVGNQVNSDGKILCPCHVSYFDVLTGVPDADAPAKAPLPRLGWVVMDKAGAVVASMEPGKAVNGSLAAGGPGDHNVFIAKYHTRTA
jgi:nitrate reductase gamma subunit